MIYSELKFDYLTATGSPPLNVKSHRPPRKTECLTIKAKLNHQRLFQIKKAIFIFRSIPLLLSFTPAPAIRATCPPAGRQGSQLLSGLMTRIDLLITTKKPLNRVAFLICLRLFYYRFNEKCALNCLIVPCSGYSTVNQ
jgi:hypothetical protein